MKYMFIDMMLKFSILIFAHLITPFSCFSQEKTMGALSPLDPSSFSRPGKFLNYNIILFSFNSHHIFNQYNTKGDFLITNVILN